ncbi:hypothetical protein PENSPDRAFT_571721 [Peniophora sp. CONT]|nr:hypothetical protein PENSPDRAFT_571721 [Peniophora sp. CONT]
MERVAKALLAPKALRADVVVLNEYKTLLAALAGTTGSLSKETKSVVVSGQPGIGMTTFLLFLLLHRLENELPTALQLNSRYYFIFDAHGVLTLPINAIDEDDRLDECWALVDSNFDVASPCGVLIDNAKRVIQTTSPKVERWKEWRKQVRAKLYIMGLPNVMEIAAIVKEHKLDPSLTFLYASKWGPCSRAIIDVLECIDAGDDVGDIERSLDESANSAAQAICTTPSLFRDFMLGSDDRPSSFNSLGSSLLFIGPLRKVTTEGSRLVRSGSMPVVSTKYLLNILLSAWRSHCTGKSLELYGLFSSHSFTRTGAAWMLEFRMHAYLSVGDQPLLVSKAGHKTKYSLPPSSNFIPGTLDALCATVSSASFYWLPDAKNFPGIDGVLGISDAKAKSSTTTPGSNQTSPHIDIYALQATIAHAHGSPVKGLRAIWKYIRHLQNMTLHVVVVTDEEASASRIAQKFKEKLKNFTVGKKNTKHVPVKVWAGVLPT